MNLSAATVDWTCGVRDLKRRRAAVYGEITALNTSREIPARPAVIKSKSAGFKILFIAKPFPQEPAGSNTEGSHDQCGARVHFDVDLICSSEGGTYFSNLSRRTAGTWLTYFTGPESFLSSASGNSSQYVQSGIPISRTCPDFSMIFASALGCFDLFSQEPECVSVAVDGFSVCNPALLRCLGRRFKRHEITLDLFSVRVTQTLQLRSWRPIFTALLGGLSFELGHFVFAVCPSRPRGTRTVIH
jgi:hypothetical protein